MSFIVNESNYFEIRSKAALAKLSSMNENITRTCVYRNLPPWESKLLWFCCGAISLAHANAEDLFIPIKARPLGICYQDFRLITMSDYSLKNENKICALAYISHRKYYLCTLTTSSLAKVPIRFSPVPLGGFRQVFKHLANLRLTSFPSNIKVLYGL